LKNEESVLLFPKPTNRKYQNMSKAKKKIPSTAKASNAKDAKELVTDSQVSLAKVNANKKPSAKEAFDSAQKHWNGGMNATKTAAANKSLATPPSSSKVKTPTFPTLHLVLSPSAYYKIIYMANISNVEVGYWGIGSKDDPLYIEDVRVLPQTSSEVSNDFDPEALGDYYEEHHEEFNRYMLMWGHTHPKGMKPNPSTVDETTMATSFAERKHIVMFIASPDGSVYARLQSKDAISFIQEMPVIVDWESIKDCTIDVESWKKEFEDNVTQFSHRQQLHKHSGYMHGHHAPTVADMWDWDADEVLTNTSLRLSDKPGNRHHDYLTKNFPPILYTPKGFVQRSNQAAGLIGVDCQVGTPTWLNYFLQTPEDYVETHYAQDEDDYRTKYKEPLNVMDSAFGYWRKLDSGEYEWFWCDEAWVDRNVGCSRPMYAYHFATLLQRGWAIPHAMDALEALFLSREIPSLDTPLPSTDEIIEIMAEELYHDDTDPEDIDVKDWGTGDGARFYSDTDPKCGDNKNLAHWLCFISNKFMEGKGEGEKSELEIGSLVNFDPEEDERAEIERQFDRDLQALSDGYDDANELVGSSLDEELTERLLRD